MSDGNKTRSRRNFYSKWIHKLESRATIRSMFIIYLGLDIDIKDYGIDDYELWQLNSQWRTPRIMKICIKIGIILNFQWM
jgi:hypothetical protein